MISLQILHLKYDSRQIDLLGIYHALSIKVRSLLPDRNETESIANVILLFKIVANYLDPVETPSSMPFQWVFNYTEYI